MAIEMDIGKLEPDLLRIDEGHSRFEDNKCFLNVFANTKLRTIW